MKTIDHRFVEFIPEQDDIENGVIYISLEYDTAVHNCICGCGQQVVTPLSPTDWKVIYDGETISLYPSIGNWEFNCQSHYWIKNSRILPAEAWSKEQIKSSRKFNLQAKNNYYKSAGPAHSKDKKSFIQKLKNFIIGKV